MKKTLSILLSLALILTSFAYLAPSAAQATTTFTFTTDTSVQKTQLANFNELKNMFNASPVDLPAVKAKYKEKFQAVVTASYPDIDARIIFVLDAAIAGQMSSGQAKQAVDKGLQWFFYNEITNFTKVIAVNALTAGKKAEAKEALEKAIELYQGSLQSTAFKRDEKYGTMNKQLLDTVIIPKLYETINANDVTAYQETRQMLDKTFIKVFVQATMTYAEKVVVEKDVPTAKIQLTEGYFFFMPIFNSLKGSSKVDAEYIENVFGSGDPTKMDLAAVKQAFMRALNAKVTIYIEKVKTSLSQGDVSTARIAAMEGNMFVAAQEIFMKEKLGASVYAEVLNHGTKYHEAVASLNLKEVSINRFKVAQVIAKLDGVSFKVNSKDFMVNGNVKEANAVSYIDKKTNRTLVPTRLVIEALGAEVSFKNATKTITIKKDGNTFELVLNKDTVVKNGQLVEELKLDQTVVVEKGISYLPIRAVAELMQNKVYYSKGEIIIVK